MTKIIITLTLLLLSSAAYSGKFNITEYECSQMDAERDGFKCLVNEDEELLMRIHIRDDAPADKLARSKYLYEVTQRNFLAAGGKYIKVRNKHRKNSAGVELEKSCSRYKGRGALICGEWLPPED